MTYLITLLDNNVKFSVHIGVDIHRLYFYIEIIGSPTIVTTLVQRSRHFFPSSSTKNDTATLHPVIAVCRMIRHKSDACIIRSPLFLPTSFRIKMNQFNALRVDKPTDTPRDWNIQHP